MPSAPSATSPRCAPRSTIGRPAHRRRWPSPTRRSSRGAPGIGHTRWATHGRVSEENAHPHFDNSDRIHIVVNGIVENYLALKDELVAGGAEFTSETDAEVIAHLVAHHIDLGLVEAVRQAYLALEGHYAFVAMSADEPGLLVGARKECPLIIGRGDGEQFIGSAIPAFLRDTRRVQYIENGELVVLRPEGVEFLGADGLPREREVVEIDWDAETAEKQGYETFMLKEINEQADAVAETIGERAARDDGIDLGPLGTIDDELLRSIRRVVVVACGTSYHAGLIGRYAIEEWARVPVEVDIASEYRYRNPVVGPGDLVIGISQSGETADTLAAMRTARGRGASVLAITNIMGSQATRDADGVLLTRAGLEIGVAATKTFVSQVAAMYLIALHIAEVRGAMEPAALTAAITELKRLPHLIAELLEHSAADLERDRRPGSRRRLLPLSRPARGSTGGARGRAEAQGDLLHRHRRLRRRRDEARPDRAARREHAGGRRGDRVAGAAEGHLQHPGGARPGGPRDRGRQRRATRRSPSTPTRSSASRARTGCSRRCSR